ncbi:hypothetical protein BJY14_002311 [Actinomadura luteofluorescens]|uniref:Uncharacterized protein n=1 Tax=Actinomadura luteofluorescens TaxID=46163 RepID=A0A7Y9JF77_9ACTN|nr:hypothetical protein [Actinomadura luteofluorescens]
MLHRTVTPPREERFAESRHDRQIGPGPGARGGPVRWDTPAAARTRARERSKPQVTGRPCHSMTKRGGKARPGIRGRNVLQPVGVRRPRKDLHGRSGGSRRDRRHRALSAGRAGRRGMGRTRFPDQGRAGENGLLRAARLHSPGIAGRAARGMRGDRTARALRRGNGERLQHRREHAIAGGPPRAPHRRAGQRVRRPRPHPRRVRRPPALRERALPAVRGGPASGCPGSTSWPTRCRGSSSTSSTREWSTPGTSTPTSSPSAC